VTPPNFHFVSLNQGIVLPAQGINLRCHVTKAKALCVDDGFEPPRTCRTCTATTSQPRSGNPGGRPTRRSPSSRWSARCGGSPALGDLRTVMPAEGGRDQRQCLPFRRCKRLAWSSFVSYRPLQRCKSKVRDSPGTLLLLSCRVSQSPEEGLRDLSSATCTRRSSSLRCEVGTSASVQIAA
jgi:hypothetical protein